MTIQTDGINKDSYGNKEIQEGRLVYAADAESTDTYVISLQPAATEMVTGMVINFYCTTANTGAATLNVNGLGAKTIKKLHDQDLATGDIEAGQIVTVVYDGTNFQMQSQTATVSLGSIDIDGGTIDGTTIGGTTAAAVTGTTVIANTTAYIGDTANANATQGLTINQGANDNEILALKSSDVSHTVTTDTEADTYLLIKKNSATAGGALVRGLTDVDAEGALVLEGIIGATDPTDTNAALVLVGSKQSGTTTAALGAAETVMQLKNRTTDLITVLGDGTTTFAAGVVATTLKATSGAAAAVVVSDSDGNLSADTTPALGTPSSGDLQNCTLATPSVKGVATLPTLTNLLTNSQCIACSGSTLENVGSAIFEDQCATDGTGNYTKGANATLADGTGHYHFGTSDTSGAFFYVTAAQTTVVGKLYKVSVTISDGDVASKSFKIFAGSVGAGADSGTSPVFTTTATPTAVTLVFEATVTSTYISFGSNSTNYGGYITVDAFTFFEVTPGYVAADAVAPDTMTKTSTLDVHQYWNAGSANTYGYGTYLIKLTKGADTAEYLNFGTALDYRQAQGRPVTLGCYVYSVTAIDNIKLSIHDGVSEIAVSAAVGADAITWVEVTGTVAANASALTPRILCDGDTSDVAYISEPILVRGSSIGTGNYAPILNEQILTAANITLTNYTATTAAADAIIILEAASSGMIGKGVKAVLVKAYGKDSAAGDNVGFDVQSASGVEDGISIDTQANNIRVQGQGWVKCDANGDIYFDHRGSGAAALTVDIKVIGIQT